MRLLIREHAFSWTDRFHVTDEEGNDRYFVEGEFFSFGRKLHITTPEGREVARVEQEVFRFRPRYTVLVNGQPRAQIVREFTFFRPVYTVEAGLAGGGQLLGTRVPGHGRGTAGDLHIQGVVHLGRLLHPGFFRPGRRPVRPGHRAGH